MKDVKEWEITSLVQDKNTGIQSFPHLHPFPKKPISVKELLYSKIFNFLRTCKDISIDSDEPVNQASDWEVYHYIKKGKANILDALEIKGYNKILMLGFGHSVWIRFMAEKNDHVDCVVDNYFEARLCKEHCREMNNIRIIYAPPASLIPQPEYDVVLICQDTKRMVKRARSWIHSQGKIIYFSHTVNTEKEKQFYCFPSIKDLSTIINPRFGYLDLHLYNWIDPRAILFKDQKGNINWQTALEIYARLKKADISDLVPSVAIIEGGGDFPGWTAKRYSAQRKKNLECVTTFFIKPEPIIVKKRLFSNKKVMKLKNKEWTIIHKTGKAPWIEGELYLKRLYHFPREMVFFKKITCLVKPYREFIRKNYGTGNLDNSGYEMISGSALDCIFSNLVQKKDTLIYIDDEWQSVMDIPEDYLLFRCLMRDIITGHESFLLSNIANSEQFIIDILKNIYPQYDNKRYQASVKREEQLQNLLSAKIETQRLAWKKKIGLVKNDFLWNLGRKIWQKIPDKLRMKIKKILLK